MSAKKTRPLDELKDGIRLTFNQLNADQLQKVSANFRDQLQQFVAQNGHHLLDVIFHT